MLAAIAYDNGRMLDYVENPSIELVRRALEYLGSDAPEVKLYGENLDLTVCCDTGGQHFKVTLADRTNNPRLYVVPDDHAARNSEEDNQLLEFLALNGEASYLRLKYTVSRQEAIDIGLYFAEHEALPPDVTVTDFLKH